jgi:hypothetical protein
LRSRVRWLRVSREERRVWGEGARVRVTRCLAISVAARWRAVWTVEGRGARAVGR